MRIAHQQRAFAGQLLEAAGHRLAVAGATLALATLFIAACAGTPVRVAPSVPQVQPPPEALTVAERYVSVETPAEELDSLATWPTPDGRTWLIATGKSSHRLVVYDADSGVVGYRPVSASR